MIFTASATIRVGRFVKVSGAHTVAEQTTSGGLCIGVSQDGGRAPAIPLNTTSPVEAAQSGETLNVHVGDDSEYPRVLVGTGGLTAGGEVMSDTSGQGVAATTGKYVQGIAMETAAAGEWCPIRPVCYQLN
jgi:hypothetical protein